MVLKSISQFTNFYHSTRPCSFIILFPRLKFCIQSDSDATRVIFYCHKTVRNIIYKPRCRIPVLGSQPSGDMSHKPDCHCFPPGLLQILLLAPPPKRAVVNSRVDHTTDVLSLSSAILIDSSTENPIQVLMLSILACMHLPLFPVLFLQTTTLLPHGMLASFLWPCLTIPPLLQLC